MKKHLLMLLAAACLFTAYTTQAQHLKQKQFNYTIDLNNRSDDTFKVRLAIKGKGLKAENNVFQFAATAPGTYQTMNIGRYVSNFKAFDKKGNEVATEALGMNQYRLSEPGKVRSVTYEISETWDNPGDGSNGRVYKMCGTSIEDDHVLINTHCVLGYVTGMQKQPFTIALDYPEAWAIGTPLEQKGNTLLANDFDHAVDSPILLGNLTKATTQLSGADVDIFTYSKTGLITSEQLLNAMTGMLAAAEDFLVQLPVNRYTFLYHFEDESWGAWEHSYSSEYVYREAELTDEYASRIISTAAHEFFHVVTPLNIHSEIIESFNFETPTPSQHLWLYEGVTEWASDAMQLRANMIDLPEYLGRVTEKLEADESYDSDYSLVQLSLTSFEKEGQQQYGNIYMRGSVVGTLLDIKLLELSGGKRGLREVMNELAKTYGPSRAFSEDEFFDYFTQITYPEVADFFNQYVKAANPLPVADYFKKLGISYTPARATGNTVGSVGYSLSFNGEHLVVSDVEAKLKAMGLQDGDLYAGFNGEEITMANIRSIVSQLRQMEPGDAYQLTVERAGQRQDLDLTFIEIPEVEKHLFEVDATPTTAQQALREAWLKNL